MRNLFTSKDSTAYARVVPRRAILAPMRSRLIVLMLLALAACTNGGSTKPTASASGTPRPPSLVVVARNIQIGRGIDHAVRFGFAPDDPTARVIVTYPDNGSIVAACGLGAIDQKIAGLSEPTCFSELPSGVRHEMALLSGLKGAAFWVRTGEPVRADVRIEFAEGTRAISIRLPSAPAIPDVDACKDNGCNAVIEIAPVKAGRFTATASWSGGSARLALLEGTVLAKSFTATGIPYRIDAEQESPVSASIEAELSAPAEYALVLDKNGADLTDVQIQTDWP